MDEEEKVEKKKVEKPKVISRVIFSPEQIASRQRAHELKVAKFLAGGEF